MEVHDVERCCCVVTLTEAFSARGPVSFSGVIIYPSTGALICTGLPFLSFIADEKSSHASERRLLLRHNFRDNLKIGVTFSSRGRVEANACGVGESCSPTGSHCTQEHEAELLMLVNCVEFKETFQTLFHQADQWCFHGDVDDDLIRDVNYLSWFAVLKARTPHLGPVSWRMSSSLQKGSPVVACGSPFGSLCSDLFNGTVSRGVVSNLAGEDNAIILTDARCLPGTEGGGLFAMEDDHLHLVGVIVSPFGWKANEWIGLTLVCSIHSILRNIVQCADIQDPLRDVWLHPTEVFTTRRSNVGDYPIVCLVESGQQWGSGVVVTSELVLTCRHVVNGKAAVALKFYHGDRVLDNVGDVLFSTKASSPYDVAVVQPRESIVDVVIPRMAHEFNTGECVMVVGYGGLGRRCGPSLTCGVLSKAISLNRQTIMFQTTCAVQAGASGGAVVRPSTGELLGIVSSNTRDLSAKVTYPHLNFCVPVSVLQGPLHRFSRSGHAAAFDALDAAEEQVKRVWRLQDTQSKL
ncbi:peroxisomal leader peptide-processing protease isoform X1 [Syngnathoides biaculeatus]|uniref:peroxisomal leader peptide-processing protease isoform X1 n=1 Tax=Syngnathoides biaculeatus TaxID=300417 RepID=UPI002ADE0DC8|nr:peroxisomal leader peptide-processing protease isoform X1 [Syngnathoides biaculeatus]